jgi:hypothetical protein
MKNILKIVLSIFILLLTSTSVNAQQQLNPYKGLWVSQNGNTLFMVILYQEGEVMKGHYKMVELSEFGEQTNVIYTSKKDFGLGMKLPFSILGRLSSYGLTGMVDDTTIPNYHSDTKEGHLAIKIIPACVGCGVQATWKIDTHIEVTLEGEPPFNIPTDIVLTRISNIVPSDF